MTTDEANHIIKRAKERICIIDLSCFAILTIAISYANHHTAAFWVLFVAAVLISGMFGRFIGRLDIELEVVEEPVITQDHE